MGSRKRKLDEDFTGIQGNGSKVAPVRSSCRINVFQSLFSHMWFVAVFKTMDGTHFVRDLRNMV